MVVENIRVLQWITCVSSTPPEMQPRLLAGLDFVCWSLFGMQTKWQKPLQ